jgi:hypothetical protein
MLLEAEEMRDKRKLSAIPSTLLPVKALKDQSGALW